jgi:hypothetical protein
VLHNHGFIHELKAGDIFLLDAGAETKNHYAGDLSSSMPVSDTFTERQAHVYDIHLRTATHQRLRAAGTPKNGLVVADWSTPLAVAVPGRPGHLLVTSGMLRLLDADQRRVLFAHENAHLNHRHHRLVTLTACAAAVNPLLIPVRAAVAYLVERWADEDAAAVTDADRRRREQIAECVREQPWCVAFEAADEGVGGTQVDADDHPSIRFLDW